MTELVVRRLLIDLEAPFARHWCGNDAFRTALKHLAEKKPHRAKRVLLSFSDPTTKPLAKATVKGATGAWPGKS